MTRLLSIIIIIAAGFFSIIISTAKVNYGATELAALIYVFVPAIITIITIVLFVLGDLFITKKRIQSTIIFIIVNILSGIFMRIDFYYNIINW